MQDLKLDFTYCFKQAFAWCSRFARENALSKCLFIQIFSPLLEKSHSGTM